MSTPQYIPIISQEQSKSKQGFGGTYEGEFWVRKMGALRVVGYLGHRIRGGARAVPSRTDADADADVDVFLAISRNDFHLRSIEPRALYEEL